MIRSTFLYRSRRPTVRTTGSSNTIRSSSGCRKFRSVPFGIVTTFPATPGKSLITRSRSAVGNADDCVGRPELPGARGAVQPVEKGAKRRVAGAVVVRGEDEGQAAADERHGRRGCGSCARERDRSPPRGPQIAEQAQ